MQVEVRVFCGLEACLPGTRSGEPMAVPITPDESGRMLVAGLNIPEEKVFSFLVNGVRQDLSAVLADGDRVAVFPAVGGG